MSRTFWCWPSGANGANSTANNSSKDPFGEPFHWTNSAVCFAGGCFHNSHLHYFCAQTKVYRQAKHHLFQILRKDDSQFWRLKVASKLTFRMILVNYRVEIQFRQTFFHFPAAKKHQGGASWGEHRQDRRDRRRGCPMEWGYPKQIDQNLVIDYFSVLFYFWGIPIE